MLFTTPVVATTIWIDPGSDDWFDATNWNNGIPTFLEATWINNGGTAVADATSGNYPAPGIAAETADLTVGYRSNPIAISSTGHLQLDDVDLAVSGELRVGVVDTGIFAGSALGSINSTKDANNGGDVSVAGDVDIGVHRSGSGGTANGAIGLVGDLAGSGGNLDIGVTGSDGNAIGSASINGDLSGFQDTNVGVTRLDSTGNATGNLTVHGAVDSLGPASGGFIVGTVAGSGITEGHATIDNGLNGFNIVLVGAGSADGDATGSSTASLDVLAGGVHSGGSGFSFEIGNTNGPGGVFASANVNGGVSGYEVLAVGNARDSFAPSGNATGMLTISSGGLLGTATGGGLNNANIGTTDGAGHAFGNVEVTGNVGGFQNYNVGVTHLDSTGNATGNLTVHGAVDSLGPASGGFIVGTVAGSGITEGHATIDNSLNGFNIVLVGAGSADGDATGSSTASLDVLAGGVHSGGSGFSFEIGNTNGPGSVLGTANVAGGISGYGVVAVGNARDGFAPSGNANGALIVQDGGLSGTGLGGPLDILHVGTTDGAGNGQGSVEVTGGVTAFQNIEVGVTHTGSTGTADGSLFLHGGNSTAGSMQVGVSDGSGQGSGEVSIDHGLLTLDETLALGSGSDITFFIDGLNRGIDYGAFDVQAANLDGILDIVFDVQPVGFAIYDLIVSESSTGIVGNFTSVNFLGLSPGTMVSSGIELVDFGIGDVEVYRLRVGDAASSVPEPVTMILFAPGLLWVFMLGSRRKRVSRSSWLLPSR